jgi:hypothetical protein
MRGAVCGAAWSFAMSPSLLPRVSRPRNRCHPWLLAALTGVSVVASGANTTLPAVEPVCSPDASRRLEVPAFGEMPRTAIHHVTDGGTDRLPEFQKVATIEVVKSGRWSEIFRPSDLESNDIVRINSGVSVVYDVMSDVPFKALVIQGGSFVVAPEVNTRLTVGTILMLDGRFEMKPVATVRAEVVFSGRIDRQEDPAMFSIGFVATGGTVDVEGVAPRKSYARLATRVEPGASSFEVDRDIDWKVGDALILAGVTFSEADHHSALDVTPANEQTTIAAISGRTVTVSAPFTVLHEEGAADLTRNVQFTSAESSDKGHLILLHDAMATIRGASFDRMGRARIDKFDDTKFDAETGLPTHLGTNQRGRYILHAHHVHNPVVIEDNVITGYPELRWCVSIHASHGVVSRNILVNPGGAGLVAENGFETGVWRDNVAFGNQGGLKAPSHADDAVEGGLLADGIHNRQDFGFEGSGFWVRSKTVDLIGNVTEGAFRQAGYFLYFFQPSQQIHEIDRTLYPAFNGVVTPYQGQTFQTVSSRINEGALPRGRFVDNSSFSYGLSSQSESLALGTKWAGGSVRSPFVADHFTVRHGGYSLMYSGPQKIINSSLDGSGARPDYVCRYNLTTDNTHALIIENTSIVNYRIAFKGYCGSLTLRNVYLNNREGEIFVPPHHPQFTVLLDNVKFGGSERRIVMESANRFRQPEFRPGFGASRGGPNPFLWEAISEAPQTRVVVTNYDQVPGDNFEVLFREQGPDTVLPNLGGVSNQELRSGRGTTPTSTGVYGRMINGWIPDHPETRPGIVGYVIPIRSSLPLYDLSGPILHADAAASSVTLRYLLHPDLRLEPGDDQGGRATPVTGGKLVTEQVRVDHGLNKVTRDLPGVGKYTFLVLRD